GVGVVHHLQQLRDRAAAAEPPQHARGARARVPESLAEQRNQRGHGRLAAAGERPFSELAHVPRLVAQTLHPERELLVLGPLLESANVLAFARETPRAQRIKGLRGGVLVIRHVISLRRRRARVPRRSTSTTFA